MNLARGLVVAASVFVLYACDADDPGATYGYGNGSIDEGCHRFTTCGTCTPVSGCGWCFDSNGTGQCASGPDSCSTPAFDWTWNPDGCRVAADAGAVKVSSRDAGAVEAAPADAAAAPIDPANCPQLAAFLPDLVAAAAADAGSSDAADVERDVARDVARDSGPSEASVADANGDGSNGAETGHCIVQPLGNLCPGNGFPGSVFQVSCTTTANWPEQVVCEPVTAPTPSDELFFCCGCSFPFMR